MFYEFDLTIPANTPASAPAELTVSMDAGIIKQVEVQLPRGLRSLVHTVAVRSYHQLWPSNPDGSIKGDNARIVWGEDYNLTQPPYSVILRGWSPGTSYSHVVTWRFAVSPPPVKETVPPPKKRSLLSPFGNKGAS